ncbi:EAL domain-containing protein [Acholeplasma sp. OttesenSCG-928-E16]|nr:EAL domain-containing protein [Acholeplasma sp. OttesenSCG-928-E16]
MNALKGFAAGIKKIEESNIIKAIRKGFTDIVPALLIGAFILVILNFPIPAYQNFMVTVFGDNWKRIGLGVHRGTMGIMSVLATVSISNAYIKQKKEYKEGKIQSNAVVMVALVSFFAYNFRPLTIDFETAEGITYILTSQFNSIFNRLGATGILQAIVVSIASAELFVLFSTIKEWIDAKRKKTISSNYLTYNMFKMIFPMVFTVLCFSALGYGEEVLFGEDTLTLWVTNSIASRMNQTNVFYPILLVFLTQVFWFMGMHGGNIVMDSLNHVGANADLTIFNKPFFDTYVFIGGAGATIGLLIALFALSLKNKEFKEKSVVKSSIIPGIFNINETLVYGLPIIFSSYFIIPFILTPIILTLTSFGAISIGMIQAMPVSGNQDVWWTTPILFSGYMNSGWGGFGLQLINLLLTVGIYLPFAIMYKKNQRARQMDIYKSLCQEVFSSEKHEVKHSILNRSDEIGVLANALMDEIRNSFKSGESVLHLEYQPKVEYDNTVAGCEALLRWDHPVFGYISPAITLRLIEDANMMITLGDWVIKTAWEDYLFMKHNGVHVLVSSNLSPIQLNDDPQLITKIFDLIKELHLDTTGLELELTENKAIYSSPEIKETMRKMRDLGISVSIDDFGMGHSSLLYLSDLYANIIKIDMELVRSVAEDDIRKSIVRSIIDLCKKIDVKVVAEGVETKEQLDTLEELGCDYYQGWYFSKAIKKNDFIHYCRKHGFKPPISRK